MRTDPESLRSVRLAVGVLTGAPDLLAEIRATLAAEHGPVDLELGPLPFDFTRYYEPEMGTGLVRAIFSFERTIDAASLPDLKRRSISLEEEFARRHAARLGVRRPVNLDPGYITPSKLVLATTKDFSHRVYLRDGIFAEVTLHWQDGVFRPQPWTYPDYRTPAYLDFFSAVRRKLTERGTD
ncbi:MAG: DUF4416 family protein [Planctomycetes bacterium]|nr:DUF4416 family protein [Planctomycetota bacterium]